VNNTSFHPPVSLADARERRARRQRPYPAVFVMPTAAEIAEADERHDIARANRWVLVLVLITLAPLLVALGLHLYFR
jgi:hypothetical protein